MSASLAEDISAESNQPGSANWNNATWKGGQWSDGAAPSSGKTYCTGNFTIRTVEKNSSTFGGNSLTVR